MLYAYPTTMEVDSVLISYKFGRCTDRLKRICWLFQTLPHGESISLQILNMIQAIYNVALKIRRIAVQV